MSSYQEERECPQCKNPYAFYELNCHSGREFLHCKECGYEYTSEHGEKRGFGAYFISLEGGIGNWGSLERGAKLKDFLHHITMDERVIREKSYVTKWSERRETVEKFDYPKLLQLEKEGKL